MRKKILVFLLTVAVCVMAAGCGNDDSNNAAAAAVSDVGPATGYEDEMPADDSGEKVAITSPEDAYPDGAEPQTEDMAEDDFGKVPEEDIVPKNATAEANSGDAGIQGILMLQNYYRYADDSGNMIFFSIMSVSPDTGIMQPIAAFSVKEPFNTVHEDSWYIVPKVGMSNLVGGDRCIFSDDYSKMALTKCFGDKNETHAGWIDQDGNFLDVTEALGEQSGDFGEPVNYAAVGFDNEGNFVYKDNFSNNPNEWVDANFYYTPVTSLAPGEDGNLIENWIWIRDDRKTYHVTDVIDDSRYVVDFQNNSAIYDTNTGLSYSYIPGESRINWSGVVSPDSGSIAFLSVPNNTNDTYRDTAIYITSVSGGMNPTKVDCDLLSGCDGTMLMWSLLDWR